MFDSCKAMSDLGRGIGNVSRYHIVEALFSSPKTVGQLSKITKQSQPLVSQHLRVLKETGLVKNQRQGQEVLYTLNVEYTVLLLRDLLEKMRPHKKIRGSSK